MITISISNIKGGVAKTTTSENLAFGLWHKGYKVLLIDADPQANLTMCISDELKEEEPSLYTLYSEHVSISAIKKEIKPGLDLVPADFSLCSSDMEFLGKVGSLKMLSKALKKCKNDYDFCIIDNPPNLGFLTLNSFFASDFIISPMATDTFSLKAIRLLHQTIKDVEEDQGKKLPVIGILLTKYDERTTISKILRTAISSAADLLNTQIFETTIRSATVIQQSQLLKSDLFEYAPNANVTKDYSSFVDEVLERIEECHGIK